MTGGDTESTHGGMRDRGKPTVRQLVRLRTDAW
jgi:hypothetical protein